MRPYRRDTHFPRVRHLNDLSILQGASFIAVHHRHGQRDKALFSPRQLTISLASDVPRGGIIIPRGIQERRLDNLHLAESEGFLLHELVDIFKRERYFRETRKPRGTQNDPTEYAMFVVVDSRSGKYRTDVN